MRKLHLCFLLSPKHVQGHRKTNRRFGVAMGYCDRAGLFLASLHGEAQDTFHSVLSCLPELILELAKQEGRVSAKCLSPFSSVMSSLLLLSTRVLSEALLHVLQPQVEAFSLASTNYYLPMRLHR